VKKAKPPGHSGKIRKTEVGYEPLTFSFKHFVNHERLSPKEHPDGYAQKLAERLRDLSRWTVAQFTQRCDHGVRNHRITWPDTSQPIGFDQIPAQVREGEEWQFSISANEYGRVHGLLIGSVFHVVWLDCNHQLYPES